MNPRAGNPRVLAAIALAGIVASGAAHAERADRDRPVNIESDRMSADDARRTAVFEGRVVLSQGTLTIRAERITVRQDNEGFQHGVATGSPATFRQKREGAAEYVEGEAERIEYDGKADRVQFFSRARLRRDGGDDVRGNFISYDSKTEYFTVQSAGDAARVEDRRVRAVIMPKNRDSTGAAQPPADPGRGERSVTRTAPGGPRSE